MSTPVGATGETDNIVVERGGGGDAFGGSGRGGGGNKTRKEFRSFWKLVGWVVSFKMSDRKIVIVCGDGSSRSLGIKRRSLFSRFLSLALLEGKLGDERWVEEETLVGCCRYILGSAGEPGH